MKYLILIALLSITSVFASAQKENILNDDLNPISAYAWQPNSDQNLVVEVTNFKDSIIVLPLSNPTFVTIKSSHRKWFEISQLNTLFYDYYKPENNYRIKKSDLLTSFKEGNKGEFIMLYQKDNLNSKITGKFAGPGEARILKIKPDFVKVSYIDSNNLIINGWVERWRLCGNPLTTCP